MKFDSSLECRIKPGNWCWNKKAKKLEYEQSEDEKLFKIKRQISQGIGDFLKLIWKWNRGIDKLNGYEAGIAPGEKRLVKMEAEITKLEDSLGYNSYYGRSSRSSRTGSSRFPSSSSSSSRSRSRSSSSSSSSSSRRSSYNSGSRTLTEIQQEAKNKRAQRKLKALKEELERKSKRLDKQKEFIKNYRDKILSEKKFLTEKAQQYLQPGVHEKFTDCLFELRKIDISEIGPYLKLRSKD